MSYKIWIQPARHCPDSDALVVPMDLTQSAVRARKGEEPSAFLLAVWLTYQE